jgi:predicted acetyltransferase
MAPNVHRQRARSVSFAGVRTLATTSTNAAVLGVRVVRLRHELGQILRQELGKCGFAYSPFVSRNNIPFFHEN